MAKLRFIYWQADDGMWLGYLDEFPDYWTQGTSGGELEANLRDLYNDLSAGHVPGARRVGELDVAQNAAISSRSSSYWVAG